MSSNRPKFGERIIKKAEAGVRNSLSYAVSVPERIILSGISVFVGFYEALTDILFPKWFKKTTSYRVTLGLLSGFLQRHVADVHSTGGITSDVDPSLPDDPAAYMHRKTAGTVIEAVGLATFRFSPLWMFAIISDVVGGSSVYFDHLVHHLKLNGIISEDFNGKDTNDLLNAIQKVTDQAATIIDMPPVTIEQTGESLKSLTDSLKMTKEQAEKMLPETESIWKEMNRLSASGVTLEQLTGLLTIEAMENIGDKGGRTANALAGASSELFNTFILESYKETLAHLSKEGPLPYFNRRMKPYMKSILKLFSPKRETLTQKAIHWLGERNK